MGVAHHSVYPVWMEIARTELLRQVGIAYSDLEKQGILFVVARMSVRYRAPARYDDVVQVKAWEVPGGIRSRVKIDHDYEVTRDSQRLATASTTLVCVNRNGKAQPIPGNAVGWEQQ